MFACHLDMNFAAFKRAAVEEFLRLAAQAGFDTVVFELEDKVQLDTLGSAVHPDAFTKAEFREILNFARSLKLQPLPLLQTLGHAEYVLKAPEFAEFKENNSPDCYCVSRPEVRTFIKNLLNEIADLFDNPEFFHLGGDEAYNFATCPKCAARNHSELFVEYEAELAAVLKSRHIRPCLWADMVRHHTEAREKLSRDFLIWLWNYSYTDVWKDEELLRNAGFELVICPASSSSGDSVFVPQWEFHRNNIAGACRTAVEHQEFGVCITSWSIRMGLKSVQFPWWELGNLIYKQGLDPKDAESQIKAQYAPGIDLNSLTWWHHQLGKLTGIQWTKYKDGTLPPPRHWERRMPEAAEFFAALPGTLDAVLLNMRRAAQALPMTTQWQQDFAAGVDLQIRYLAAVQKALQQCPVDLDALRRDQAEFARYLGCEQTERSAQHNAELVYGPLIEYATN